LTETASGYQETPVVVVTGATSGIGRAVCELLATQGYRVAALARGAEAATERQDGDRGIVPYDCDVGTRSHVFETVERIVAGHGRIDGLVNCAGNLVGQTLEEVTDEATHAQLRVNFFGTLYMCQACLPHLKLSQGAIVNFSSLITTRPVAGAAIYAATKGAVEAFSTVIANELAAAGIRVYVVSPSLVRSAIYTSAGMGADAYEAMLEEWRTRFPLGRVGEPVDVAPLVGFLLSDAARWMTGNRILVDGGRTIAFE
jgi:3-oxoacyl-[acyl-carrier protein] reductase